MGNGIGAFCAGLVVAYVMMRCLHKIEKYNEKTLGSIIATILGVGIFKLFGVEWWPYPVGLVVGIAGYIFLAVNIFGARPDIVAFARSDILKKIDIHDDLNAS